MKTSHFILSISALCGIFIMFLTVRSAGAQLFENPSITFQNMTFEMANRGSYNTSDCLMDLLQCWEAVKPDLICFWWHYHTTICTIVRDLCVENYGDIEGYSQLWNLAQGYCWEEYYQFYTR